MTDNWDPSIPSHKEVAHGIEIGNGIPEMRPIRMVREALVNVGFEIEHEDDLADRPDPVPWYYPLEGNIWQAQTLWDVFTVWRMSSSGKFVTHHGLWLIEKLGIVPKGTWEVGETLKIAADALVESGREKVRPCRVPGTHKAINAAFPSASSSRRCTSSCRGSPHKTDWRASVYSLLPSPLPHYRLEFRVILDNLYTHRNQPHPMRGWPAGLAPDDIHTRCCKSILPVR